MLKRLAKRPGVRRFLARLLAQYLRFALRTTRWTLHGETYARAHFEGRPCIAAFWHERLPLMPALWLMAKRRRAANRMHVLVSHHQDGRLIAEMLQTFDAQAVHGSSSRGGAPGLRALLSLLARGEMVAITPDGPRGPRRRAAPGVARLAALSGVQVLPCAGQTTHRWTLRSWDRMTLPLPFGRGVLVCAPPMLVRGDAWLSAVPEIAEALNRVTDTADALCAL